MLEIHFDLFFVIGFRGGIIAGDEFDVDKTGELITVGVSLVAKIGELRLKAILDLFFLIVDLL